MRMHLLSCLAVLIGVSSAARFEVEHSLDNGQTWRPAGIVAGDEAGGPSALKFSRVQNDQDQHDLLQLVQAEGSVQQLHAPL